MSNLIKAVLMLAAVGAVYLLMRDPPADEIAHEMVVDIEGGSIECQGVTVECLGSGEGSFIYMILR